MRCHKELCVFSTPDLLGDEAADEDPVPVTSIAFSNSGRYLFAGYDNQGARVWSVVGNYGVRRYMAGWCTRKKEVGNQAAMCQQQRLTGASAMALETK